MKRTNPAGVRWVRPSDAEHPNLYPIPGCHPSRVSGERVVAWMVILLLFTCAAVALYDLGLLLSGLR